MNKGDRVRVTRLRFTEDGDFFNVGMEGTVYDQPTTSDSITVLFDPDATGNKDYWYVNRNDLELV